MAKVSCFKVYETPIRFLPKPSEAVAKASNAFRSSKVYPLIYTRLCRRGPIHPITYETCYAILVKYKSKLRDINRVNVASFYPELLTVCRHNYFDHRLTAFTRWPYN